MMMSVVYPMFLGVFGFQLVFFLQQFVDSKLQTNFLVCFDDDIHNQPKMKCENPTCTNLGMFNCTKCRDEGFSKSFGMYCGRDCQTARWSEHLKFHKAWKKNVTKYPTRKYAETIVITLKELQLTGNLPALKSDSSLHLFALGARNTSEQDELSEPAIFESLFQNLKSFIFPELSRLKLTLVGLQAENSRNTFPNGTVTAMQGDAAAMIVTMNPAHDIAVIFQPGLSTQLRSWEKTFRQLVARNILTITTGYCGIDHEGKLRRNYDYPQDEDIIQLYFGAKMIFPVRRNPAAIDSGTGTFLNGFYLAFQGSTTPAADTTTSSGQPVVVHPGCSLRDIIQKIQRNILEAARINNLLRGNPEQARNIELFVEDLDRGLVSIKMDEQLRSEYLNEICFAAEAYVRRT